MGAAFEKEKDTLRDYARRISDLGKSNALKDNLTTLPEQKAFEESGEAYKKYVEEKLKEGGKVEIQRYQEWIKDGWEGIKKYGKDTIDKISEAYNKSETSKGVRALVDGLMKDGKAIFDSASLETQEKLTAVGNFAEQNKFGLGSALIAGVLALTIGEMGLLGGLMVGLLAFALVGGMADEKGAVKNLLGLNNPSSGSGHNSPSRARPLTPEEAELDWAERTKEKEAKRTVDLLKTGPQAKVIQRGEAVSINLETVSKDVSLVKLDIEGTLRNGRFTATQGIAHSKDKTETLSPAVLNSFSETITQSAVANDGKLDIVKAETQAKQTMMGLAASNDTTKAIPLLAKENDHTPPVPPVSGPRYTPPPEPERTAQAR